MSGSCGAIRGMLARYVDRECDPRTSYEIARHLPECTACRIVLARERRLREALDVLPVDAAEDARIVDRVMDALGDSAPPRSQVVERRIRRGLRLASLLGAFLWLGLPASRAIRTAGLEGAGFRVAPPSPDAAGDLLGTLAQAIPMISTALEAWSSLSFTLPALQGISLEAVAAASFAAAAALAATAYAVWNGGRRGRTSETQPRP